MATTVVPRSSVARPGAYRVYTLAWAGAGVVLVLLSAPALPRFPPEYLLFAAMSLSGHVFFVLDLPGGLRLSLQAILAPVWLYGWKAAPPLFLLTVPLVLRNSRGDPLRALLYFGNGCVWAATAGNLFALLRPGPSPQPTWSELASVLVSGGVFTVGNFLVAAFGRYLATGDARVLQLRQALEGLTLVFSGYVLLAYLLLLALQTGPAAAFLAVGVWLLTAVAMKGLAETRRANERLQEALRELERLTVTDPMTGLWNRRHFVQILPKELHRHARTGRPLSLLVVDLRSLKHVNDTYGHEAGDRALQRAAGVFRDRLRGSDLAFRIGGDEFALLLPDTDTQGALTVAEAITDLLAGTRLDSAPGARLEATVGVATFPDHGRDPDALVAAADAALYRAREKGLPVAAAEG
ncbi:MAG: GGDEF domain-containing protein [Armatimonadota bacterium]|nr:GGDEF domain-containing protein [Armatimonadota bacterium]